MRQWPRAIFHSMTLIRNVTNPRPVRPCGLTIGFTWPTVFTAHLSPEEDRDGLALCPGLGHDVVIQTPAFFYYQSTSLCSLMWEKWKFNIGTYCIPCMICTTFLSDGSGVDYVPAAQEMKGGKTPCVIQGSYSSRFDKWVHHRRRWCKSSRTDGDWLLSL